MDLREFSNRVDEAVDRIFGSLPNDLARVQHELHGLRRLAARAREGSTPVLGPSSAPDSVSVDDVRVRDVLLRAGTTDQFWKVLRVRRKKKMVDVVDQDGRQRIFSILEFSAHWGSNSPVLAAMHLEWRF